MCTFEPPPRGYLKTLGQLRRQGSRLVLVHSHNPGQHGFFILPGGIRVDQATAQPVLECRDLRPHDEGLFPSCPQSWRLCVG
jgi:hypothetical protein